MRNQEEETKISRRSFLSRSTCASLGLGGLVNTMAQLRVIDAFATGATLTDYKALVCMFLRGGSDMNNIFIPTGGNPQASDYIADRGVVAVPESAISAAGTYLTPVGESAGHWGLHPNAPNLANMFNNGELAFVHNVGTLVYPITSPAQYAATEKPNQLFSHSDQQVQWQVGSTPDQPFTAGWGGKVSEYVDSLNTQGQASMLITVAGNSDYLVSPAGGVPQYSVTTNGAIALVGYGPSTNPYGSALSDPGDATSYIANSTGRRLKAFQDIMNYTHDHILEEGYNTIVRRARANEALVGEAIGVATALQGTGPGQVDFDGLFGGAADNNVGRELKMVAQLIAGRKCLGNERQIFFVDFGGHDTHQDINADLPVLWTSIDAACHAFNECMKQLDAAQGDFSYNDFLCFEASEFNRTWTPNGSNPNASGTDHAWGTHMFAFGGPVKARHAGSSEMYGTFPTLQVGGPDDVPQGSRGRWIPSTSLDQIYSVMAEWFGVAPGDLNAVFPYRTRFETDPVAANVDFMDVTA